MTNLDGWYIYLHDKLGDFHGKQVVLVKISYMDPLSAQKWKHLFFQMVFWFILVMDNPKHPPVE